MQHKLEHKLRQAQLWQATHAKIEQLKQAEQAAHAMEPPPLETIEDMPPVPAGLDAVDIFHFNDFHAHFDATHDTDRGGGDRLVAELRQLMKEYPKAIVVNVGDVAYDGHGGGNFGPIADLFNSVPVSILELGNHEFQEPASRYANLRAGLLGPFQGDVLCANVVDAKSHQPFDKVKPYTIKQLAGYNVAFVGVVTQEMATQAHPAVGAGLKVADIAETLSDLVPQAKGAGADAVVVMAHESLDNMQEVAKTQSGIDCVLAAHDHRLTRHPIEVAGADGKAVPIVEPASHGKYIGHTRLLMDPKTRQVTGVQFRVIPVDARAPL